MGTQHGSGKGKVGVEGWGEFWGSFGCKMMEIIILFIITFISMLSFSLNFGGSLG